MRSDKNGDSVVGIPPEIAELEKEVVEVLKKHSSSANSLWNGRLAAG